MQPGTMVHRQLECGGAQSTVWCPRSGGRALFAVVHAQGCLSRNCAGHLAAKHESQCSRPSELPPFSPAKQLLRVSSSGTRRHLSYWTPGRVRCRAVRSLTFACLFLVHTIGSGLLFLLCASSDQQLQGSGFGSRPRACTPLLIILRVPPHLLGPAPIPLSLTTAPVPVLDNISGGRRPTAIIPDKRLASTLCWEHFTTSSSQPTT